MQQKPETFELAKLREDADRAYRNGRLLEARELYGRLCKRGKRDAMAWVMLGVTLERLGEPGQARNAYQRAIQERPDLSGAHYNLARILRFEGRHNEAETSYRRSIALKPNFADAHLNLGALLAEQDKLDEAIVVLKKAVGLFPDNADAHFNLALALEKMEALYESAEHYLSVLRIDPLRVKALNNVAGVLLSIGRSEEALTASRQSLQIEPTNATAYWNYALALSALGNFAEATAAFQRSVSLQPDMVNRPGDLAANRGTGVDNQDVGQLFDPAKYYYGFRFKRLERCDWSDRARLETWISETAKARLERGEASPAGSFSLLSLEIDPELRLALVKNRADRVDRAASKEKCNFEFSARNVQHPRIRLGYVSADYRDHNHFHLIYNLFEKHDRDRFEVYAYSLQRGDGSVYWEQAKSSARVFRELQGLGDRDAAQRIYEDEIQVLVDLNGYTEGFRPKIFALRPAPIQVHYPIAYPGTTGANYIDYLIADKVLIRPSEEPLYTEKIVYLPEGYQGSDYLQPISSAPVRRADFGLPEDSFVFCNFSDSDKIEPRTFDIWMEILKEVENSVLWLRPGAPEVPENLAKEAAARGVGPSRLIYLSRIDKDRHLARQRLAQLFLDTPAFSAHTTAVDALWAGLPLLTCRGQTFSSRVAASILTSAGLPELITENVDDYKARAIDLAIDKVAYAAIRSKTEIAVRGSALFNTDRLARHLEKAYETMWSRYVTGRRSASFEVPAL